MAGDDENHTNSTDKNAVTDNELNEILQDQDINKVIEYLKTSKNSNISDIFDMSSSFIDGHLKGVELFLELAVKLEPEISTHHYNFATYLENQRFYDQAKDEYETAIELENDNDLYYADYGNLLQNLNEYDDAEKKYLEALDINPDNPHVWTNLGILYSNREENEKAETALKKAISIDPNSSLSYLNLIKLYKKSGQVNQAREILRKYKSLKFDDLNLNILHLD
jgi:tetratricopeptide (TPR) repeat protein